MSDAFHIGDRVAWNWAQGSGEGKIRQRFERRVQRTLKGSRIVRNGTKDNPAYLIEQEDGGQVLKRGSELSRA